MAPGTARADTLLYGFEATDAAGPVDGFARNGGGATFTVTPTVTGVTQGLTAGLFNVTPPGFTGAITSTIPSALTSPMTTDIKADISIPAGFTYTGTYGLIGVTLFVSNATTGDYGEQFQVQGASERDFSALTPGGAAKTVDIPLIGVDPSSGATSTLSTLLSEGYVPSGFEFFFDKNAPVTLQIDNVIAVQTPEPASIGMLAIGGGALLRRKRRA